MNNINSSCRFILLFAIFMNVTSQNAHSETHLNGLFLRTMAPIGDSRGMCIDLVGWTPANVKFDTPLIAHTCKHGWWNGDGQFDKEALNEHKIRMPHFSKCLEVSAKPLPTIRQEIDAYQLFAQDCNRSSRQKFSFLDSGRIIQPDDPSRCTSVLKGSLKDAGGDKFWVTSLVVEPCSETKNNRQLWVREKPS